mmetsp:Transcript_17848/g.45020  ORF Transcript_17848/g.45020 Transcript_17848/m.45020 type:complete len:204 (+) Transcript_17848:739-1350(+)
MGIIRCRGGSLVCVAAAARCARGVHTRPLLHPAAVAASAWVRTICAPTAAPAAPATVTVPALIIMAGGSTLPLWVACSSRGRGQLRDVHGGCGTHASVGSSVTRAKPWRYLCGQQQQPLGACEAPAGVWAQQVPCIVCCGPAVAHDVRTGKQQKGGLCGGNAWRSTGLGAASCGSTAQRLHGSLAAGEKHWPYVKRCACFLRP